MNILFFSTNSNNFNGDAWVYTNFPTCRQQLDQFCQNHPDYNVTVATQLPGLFLVDTICNEISEKSEKVHYEIIPTDDENEAADFLAHLKPDLAVAMSFWLAPYDWLSIKDSMIAEILEKKGIQTLYNSVKSSLICFDKFQTHHFLKQHGFNTTETLYINHELFFKTRKEIKTNVYKEAIIHQLKNFPYPAIIKDPTGLSSYNADVVNNAEEAEKIILSKRTNSDRIMEQYVQGDHFGAEIYGQPGKYYVLDPFILSLNKYGITCPKQSVKLGPVTHPKFKVCQLKSELTRLSQLMEFNGIAQVDLVFDGISWFIVDINPRLSGETNTYSASQNRLIFDMLLFPEPPQLKYVMNIKLPILEKSLLQELFSLDFVKSIKQMENKEAKQNRETGYCEMLIGSTSTLDQLMSHLEFLKKNYPQIIEPIFYANAIKMAEKIKV